MKEKDDSIFVEHIIESIDAIENFSKNLTFEKLFKDRLRKSAIVRELEMIGEASKNISSKFKEKNNKIPWKQIIGTRNLIAHKYFGIDVEILWEIIQKDLPKLKKQILDFKII